MNNPKCPYCGGEMKFSYGYDGYMNGHYWYRCDNCNALAPEANSPEEAYAADPQSCLFCRHAHRFVDPADGKPYMITCSEALKEDEIKNDEWVYVGMNGACASFEDEEENDEDRIC